MPDVHPIKLPKEDRERFANQRLRRLSLAAEIDALDPSVRARFIAVSCNVTEFEVQSHLYQGLLALGFTVRGEIKTKCGRCKFDLVVVVNDTPVRIIEVKKSRRTSGTKRFKRRDAKMRTRQLTRYAEFGVPVDSVRSLGEAKKYLAFVTANGSLPEPN